MGANLSCESGHPTQRLARAGRAAVPLLLWLAPLRPYADFERLEYWLEKVKSHASTNCEVALLCNNIDIFEGKTPSELEQESKIAGAKKIAEAEGLQMFLTR